MRPQIADYALVGDRYTAALVNKEGSIDWLCVPRFDSPSCFTALLGDERHGRWQVAPETADRTVSRRYAGRTLVLETEFTTSDGVVRLTDFMPPRRDEIDLVRIVEGVRGRVPMTSRFSVAFDYGSRVPWVEHRPGCLSAVAGANSVNLYSEVLTESSPSNGVVRFSVGEGQKVSFVLTWHLSHEEPPAPIDAMDSLKSTVAWWEDWSDKFHYEGEWTDQVLRSLITLKALTYAPTGGVVAAPTTSLPELVGGVRNWDYRYCWVRDATFTLQALLEGGFRDEASQWRDWLLRAVAGAPGQMQIMYGAAGESMLPEIELPWLPGHEGSAPVRIGNAATNQFQLDVYGELMDMFHEARRVGVEPDERAWDVQTGLMEFLESNWREPDEGIWEIRAERRHYTHSKVMAWVAADRAVKAIENFGLDGDAARWRALRADIHDEVCRHGWSRERGAFTQTYGSTELDASLLMVPLVSFLPANDERVIGTVEAIQGELTRNGLVHRYLTDRVEDGLPSGEAAFLPCTFWLVDALALMGRRDEARSIYSMLLGLANDVGLLAEEYDPTNERMLGNFPQALSHIALVRSAYTLSRPAGSEERRGE